MSLSSSAVRMMLRPMRPKPLMPTLMGILPPMECPKIAAVQERVTAAGEQKMLGVARRKVNARRIDFELEDALRCSALRVHGCLQRWSPAIFAISYFPQRILRSQPCFKKR